jgi:hypothetical protein
MVEALERDTEAINPENMIPGELNALCNSGWYERHVEQPTPGLPVNLDVGIFSSMVLAPDDNISSEIEPSIGTTLYKVDITNEDESETPSTSGNKSAVAWQKSVIPPTRKRRMMCPAVSMVKS